ncbi:SFH8 [Symbiodinium natans]|uniref:SFH8 protein n=1 Tax=Symbiodinium natans TaxID=878477 RepID=A0A812PX48_9DINO|nr:SFH8 [Symbiodinium natans]
MDPGPPAHPREFAAAFLGHSQDSHGDLECNFRVTHLPSGVFWLVRRPLSDWQHLEERLLREAGKIQRPASARGCTGSSRRSSGHAQLGGFFFRRSSDVSRKQLEKLQAQLAEMLSDSELRDSTVLQDFLGVPGQAPEMPSSVRIVKLRRRQDGDAEVQLEVQTTSERALVESRTAATHVVATVLLLRPRAGAEEDLEEIGDFKVPASSPELLTIHGLVADRAYEFQVKAVNDVGSSPSVRIRVLVPTDLPGPEEPSSEGPPTAPREPSKETAAQVSNAHAAEPSAAVPFTTEAAASQPSPEAAAAAAPDPQPSPEVDTLTKVAVPGTQPLPAADALAEAILKPAVEPTAAVEDVAEAVASHLPALDVDTLTEATSAHAVERTAAVEVAAPGTQPSPKADAPDVLAEVPAEVILRPAVEPTASIEDVAEAVASHQPAPEVDTLTEATSAHAVEGTAVEVAAPGTQPSPEADVLAQVPTEVSDQPAPEVDTLTEATSAHAVERTAAVEVAGPGMQPSPEADTPDALDEVPTEVILRPAEEPTAAVEDVAEAVASDQPAPEADTLVEATSALAVERAAVEVAAPGTQPSPEADVLAEVPTEVSDQPAPEVDTLTEVQPSQSPDPDARREIHAEPQPLRNGSSQSQSQSAGRLKPQQAAGDPYLSPHARALVNDQEDADFVNTEEARSPQRESSARSLQPPSAGYARVGSLEVRLSQLPDKKAPGAAVDQAIAHLETHYKISEQAALRLYLGCNLDMEEAKRRFDGILEWRKQYGLDQLRQSLSAALPGEAAVTAPFHKEVAKLVTINPCVLTSVEGSPVSIYYVGTAHASAAAKAEEEQLRRFGVFMAEYVDIWLSAQTSSTGRLAGHVQIYDLQGLSLWQVSSGALVEKLKILLGAGQHYMEQVSHIFVIRSSSAFSMAWNFIKGWISPRTASKIHVSSSIPTELQKLLGPSAAALPALLKNPHWTAAVQRPPFPTEE